MAEPENFADRIKRDCQSFSEMIRNPRYYFGNSPLRRATVSETNRKAMELFSLVEESVASQAELRRGDSDNLIILYMRYKQQYILLAQHMAEWEPKRRKYLEKLLQLTNDLDVKFKRFSFLKLVMSSVEFTGTIFGEIFLGSESGWDKKALYLAYSFGICETFCLTLELGQTKQILHWASVFVEKHRTRVERFVEWFRDKTLDSIINDFFPYPVDMEVMRDYQDTQSQESCSLMIFVCALVSNLRKDPTLSQDIDFIYQLYKFSTSNLARLWWNKTALSRTPFIQNFNSSATLLADLISQMKSILSHSVPAFVVEQLRLTDISTEKRIMLNLISMYDSYMNLKEDSKSDISSRLKRLRNNIMHEWENIESIASVMERC